MRTLLCCLAVLGLLVPALASTAPKKALFDNTHAETAGNADWQIDTDQPWPVPDPSTVTPATPRTYWLGANSSWAIDLVKRGYRVATNTAPITYGNAANEFDLAKWDVFVVVEPNLRFSAAESTAIFDFVRDGGGLVMVLNHSGSDRNNDGWDPPEIWNLLDGAMRFGIHAQSNGEANRNIVEDSGNVAAAPGDSILHGPNGVADSLSYHNGTTFTLHPEINPRVRGLVWMTGLAHGNTGVMAARSEYGNGRLVIVGDSSPCDDGSAAPDNRNIYDGWGEVSGRDSLFFLNATMWATRRDAGVAAVSGPPPRRLEFLKPAPHPSAGPVTLRFSVPARAGVSLDILDAQGRRVRRAALGDRAAGVHSWTWDGKRDDGRRAAPGVYTARLTTAKGRATQRVVRL